MTDFIPPTKEELKQRYNIPNDDFKILTQDSLPKLKWLECLDPVFWLHGIPTFIHKNKIGLVIAIIFIPKWGPPAAEKIADSFAMVQSAYKALHTPDMIESQKYKYAIVTTSPITLQQHQTIASTGVFPTGSGVYPYPTET